MSAPATMKQVGQIVDLFGKAPTAESVQQFISAGDLVKAMLAVGDLQHVDRDAFRALIAKPAPPQLAPFISEPYRLTIDYDQSLEQMVAAGGYDFANSDITVAHFPVKPGETTVETLLVHFDRYMEDDELTAELDRLGFERATMPELCAFGSQYPELQRQFPIVALGSLWTDRDGVRRYGCLRSGSSKRKLSLFWLDGRWSPDYRFLVRRK